MPTVTLDRRTFVASLAAWPAWARARAATPLPLLLAQDAPQGLHPAGFLVSEKYDGVRAFWDGRALRCRSGIRSRRRAASLIVCHRCRWTANCGWAAGVSRRCRPSFGIDSRTPVDGRRCATWCSSCPVHPATSPAGRSAFWKSCGRRLS